MAGQQDIEITIDSDLANQLLSEYASRPRSGKERLSFAATLLATAAQVLRDLRAMGAPIEDSKEAFAQIAMQMYEFEQSRPKPSKA